MEEEKKELVILQPTPPSSAMVEIEQSRAVQEVQAALVIAKKFPRDTNAAYTRVVEACKRITLANQATYSYPKGGKVVTGPSIRLAEVLAQNWGNLDFGVRELERRDSSSHAEAYCWDMETNVRQKKVFEVPHEIMLKTGQMKRITDPRDIYELVANQGARRLRACIIGIIPGDIVDGAVDQCKRTIAKGDDTPLVDRVRKMLVAFLQYQITTEMIEKRLGHKTDLIDYEEFVDLYGIFNAIKDKQAKRTDFFDFPDGNEEIQEGSTASALKDKLNATTKDVGEMDEASN